MAFTNESPLAQRDCSPSGRSNTQRVQPIQVIPWTPLFFPNTQYNYLNDGKDNRTENEFDSKQMLAV